MQQAGRRPQPAQGAALPPPLSVSARRAALPLPSAAGQHLSPSDLHTWIIYLYSPIRMSLFKNLESKA